MTEQKKRVREKEGEDEINKRIRSSEGESKDRQEDEHIEPLLKENPGRYVLYPIKYQQIYDMYETHQSTFWTTAEIDFKGDIDHWHTRLTDPERHFIKWVLAFFAASDGIVVENLAQRFLQEIQIPECRLFYGFQLMMENIHSDTYSRMLQAYVTEEEERQKLFEAMNTIPAIRAKAKWALKWIQSPTATFAERLLAFLAVEGIFFSGSFCAIFWLRERGLMPGLCFTNDLISRDEGLHCAFAVLLYGMLERPLEIARVHEMWREAVEIEKSFILDALPCKLLGMNAEQMSQYIEYVADRLLGQIKIPKIWNARCPFDFMIKMTLRARTNQFENRESSYSLPSQTNALVVDPSSYGKV